MKRVLRITAGLLAIALPAALAAQTGGFVTRLGADTNSVERYVRTADKIEGTIVNHAPVASMVKYTYWLGKDGSITGLELAQLLPNGSPLPNAATGLKMTFVGDTVVRDATTAAGVASTRRTAVPKGTIPSVGGSLVYAGLVIAQVRKTGEANVIGFAAQNNTATKPTVVIVNADSAEIVNQGFRVGYKTDKAGNVVRSDGTLTTGKTVGTAVKDVDVAAIATAWAAKDAAGQGVGTPSTRDSIKATIGGASLALDYGRPAMRGREIWGKLVPLDTVWRFGANWATQFRSDKDIDIGGTTVPAGNYTFWLLPTASQTFLVISKQTQAPPPGAPAGTPARPMWGTQYDPSADLARIPMQKRAFKDSAERFTASFGSDELVIQWGTAGYAVKIKGK